MEYEPLGQAIAFHDSSEPPEPSPNEPIPRRNADDPHWQCEAGRGFWGGITGYPFHCQKKKIQDLDYELKNLFGWGEQVENPSRIPGRQGQGELPTLTQPTAEEYARRKALAATQKPDNEGGNGADGCEYDANGNPTCGVNVPITIDFSDTGGYSAEVDGDDRDNYKKCKSIAKEISFQAFRLIAMAVRIESNLDPGLIAATWINEGGHYEDGTIATENLTNNNNQGRGGINNFDAGPMQINYKTWTRDMKNNDIATVFNGLDLDAVFGTTKGGEIFNGGMLGNIMAGGRILQIYTARYGSRLDAAGYYRTGEGTFTVTEGKGKKAKKVRKSNKEHPDFKERVNRVQQYLPAFDNFFKCMGF